MVPVLAKAEAGIAVFMGLTPTRPAGDLAAVYMQSIHLQGYPCLKLPTGGYNSGRAFVKRSTTGTPLPTYAVRCHRDGHATILLNGEESMGLPQPPGTDLEDCRLIETKHGTYAAYTEGHYGKIPFLAIQRLALLDKNLKFKRDIPLQHGDNGKKPEKNWQFFEHKGELHFVYSIAPVHIVAGVHSHRISAHTNNIHWPYGHMAGGTPPVRDGDHHVSFFHSFIVDKRHHRRYFAAAYRFNDHFEVTDVTPPLLVGSEDDPLNKPHPKGLNWAPLVVFPMAAALQGDTWSVIAGVNDVYDVNILIDKSELKWEPISNWTPQRLTHWKTTVPNSPFAKWERLGHTLGRLATNSPTTLAELYSSHHAQQISKADFDSLRPQRV